MRGAAELNFASLVLDPYRGVLKEGGCFGCLTPHIQHHCNCVLPTTTNVCGFLLTLHCLVLAHSRMLQEGSLYYHEV
jgi:hypothetical protein